MSILRKIFRKPSVQRGLRYLVKPEYFMSIIVKELRCEIRDVSTTGVGLISKELGKLVGRGHEVQAAIKVGDEIITLDLEIVWVKGARVGAKIVTHKNFYAKKIENFIAAQDFSAEF